MIGEDVSNLFNVLSGYSRNTEYDRLLVAPHALRDGLIERIEQETRNHLEGRPAGVRIKVNSMVDERIIDALYRASQVGVPVDIWVRGICAVRPGVAGLSETIRVRSILGRFLEHSRLYWFANGGDPQVWIGSADMMHRNLDRRVEALVRLEDPGHRADLTELLDIGFDENTDSWHLEPDGSWRHVGGTPDDPRLDIQSYLVQLTQRRPSAVP